MCVMDEKFVGADYFAQLSAAERAGPCETSIKKQCRPTHISMRTHSQRSLRMHSLRIMLLYILGAMSILLLLTRMGLVPSSLTTNFFHKKHPHSPRIIQLSRLPTSLVPSRTNDRRLIVVGDVHGCRVELEELLKEASYNKHTDHLILAGDMINKGPDSHGVIKLARDLGASAVRGNHEDKILALREQQNAGVRTLEAGSSKKKVEADRLASELSKKDLEWLTQCPLILELGPMPSLSHASDVVVVHAGLVPGVELMAQDPFAVMHMRSISKVKKVFKPNEDRDVGKPWYHVWNQEQELLRKHGMMAIYGHDSRTGLNERKWSLGLDSGCVNGERLSAVVIDKDDAKVVSVRCKQHR